MTSTTPHDIPWSAGAWTHAPVAVDDSAGDLVVTAARESDAWRHTAYGFVHDSEHALLAPFAPGTAVEVEFTADFAEQFDQAGVFVRVDEERWVKAGLEFADDTLGAGAVVTDRRSDWSVGAVPEWAGERVLVRVSWSMDALIVRAGLVDGPLRLLRVASFPETLAATAGPFLAAPTREGLAVRFHAWRVTAADASIH